MPPTLMQTAEMDVLRDEAEAYARKLDAAGVDVVVTRHDPRFRGDQPVVRFARLACRDASGKRGTQGSPALRSAGKSWKSALPEA
ncbi:MULTISPECIES: alpha/beta hydrolase fold domain-containing protein [Rhizobium]|uniref:alpha/beta hydrolase fold domain-containing protein n=1 Tax=Rhizobium TaxID=379 RepID=UPI001F0C26D2|nr:MULTISPECIES: alpha/beta hydrolase fold domain-containing protein [Rhizobium]MCH4549492.1 alpha/beta hydrolase [Rhizobium changzhiense]